MNSLSLSKNKSANIFQTYAFYFCKYDRDKIKCD